MDNDTLGDDIAKLLDNIYYQFGDGSHGFAEEHNLTHEQKWVLDVARELRKRLGGLEFATKNEIISLKQQVEDLESERDDLQDDLDAAPDWDEFHALEEENKDLHAEIEELKAQFEQEN